MKALVSEKTFRSKGRDLNHSDDMVRVTIVMKRTEWFGWKRLLKQKGMIDKEG